MSAAQNGHGAAIEAMVKLGADPNRARTTGATAMYIAAMEGQTSAVEALGRLGADPNIAQKDGGTPMYIAAEKGHTVAVEALLKLGADFNKQFQGWSPLKISRHYKHTAVVTFLEQHGATE